MCTWSATTWPLTRHRPSKKWLLAHPRFHIHFTPTASSWLDLVERWFAEVTVELIRRGVHHSVKQLAADITA